MRKEASQDLRRERLKTVMSLPGTSGEIKDSYVRNCTVLPHSVGPREPTPLPVSLLVSNPAMLKREIKDS